MMLLFLYILAAPITVKYFSKGRIENSAFFLNSAHFLLRFIDLFRYNRTVVFNTNQTA